MDRRVSRSRSRYSSILLLLALGSMTCASCSDLTIVRRVPIVAAQPVSDEVFARLLTVAETEGYELRLTQPNRRRFAVWAHYVDGHGRYAMAVECFPDGRISITPVGPRVEREGHEWILPIDLRWELIGLTAAIERAARAPVPRD